MYGSNLSSAAIDFSLRQSQTESPLEISTRYYFWKPYMAYFDAFELRAYRDVGWKPTGRVLDVGCQNGIFGQMLKELLRFETRLIGVDLHERSLPEAAQRTSVYAELLKSDVANLPFDAETFDSVFANSMLCSILPDPKQGIREISRVLKQDGTFVCTVPTNLLLQHLWLREFLERIGLGRIGRWYGHRFCKRVGVFWAFTLDEWMRAIEESGLEIHIVLPYITADILRRWSLFTPHILRVCGLLKLIPLKPIQTLATLGLRRLMAGSYERFSTIQPSDPIVCALLIARKV